MMRDDFCVFILSHRRPENIYTIKSLLQSGYKGAWYILVDDEDPTIEKYNAMFGDKVLKFSKIKVAEYIDVGDNFNERGAVVYARNACYEIARKIGVRYFLQLDDDYTYFNYKFDNNCFYTEKKILNISKIFDAVLKYYKKTPFYSISFSQGGDFIGGQYTGYAKKITLTRKAMNVFFCDTEREFSFFGKINEDVNAYTCLQRSGKSFATLNHLEIKQHRTQENIGGLTPIYLKMGTYVKSFYSVMYAPSCVVVEHSKSMDRMHHKVAWDKTAPKILSEDLRKPRP